MTDSEIGRWALVGASPAGRFLLERQRICPNFPLASVGLLPADEAAAVRTYSLPVEREYARLLHDPYLAGVIITAPRSSRGQLLQAALRAGKCVLVEGELGLPVADAHHLIEDANDRLGVFQMHRPDADFLGAKAAVRSRRLGGIHTVRYVSCAQALFDLPSNASGIANGQEILQQSCWLFDELQQLAPGSPLSVSAWSCPQTAGFVARLNYPNGASAWIDLQRTSLCGLATGWVLEGDLGAYCSRRIMTKASDGEIISEVLSPSGDHESDVMTDLARLATSSAARKASLMSAIQSAAITELIEAAMQSENPVPVQRQLRDQKSRGRPRWKSV